MTAYDDGFPIFCHSFLLNPWYLWCPLKIFIALKHPFIVCNDDCVLDRNGSETSDNKKVEPVIDFL